MGKRKKIVSEDLNKHIPMQNKKARLSNNDMEVQTSSCVSFVKIKGPCTYTIKFDRYTTFILSGLGNLDGNGYYPPGTQYNGITVPQSRILLTGCEVIVKDEASSSTSVSIPIALFLDSSHMTYSVEEPKMEYKSWYCMDANNKHIVFPNETACFIQAYPGNKKVPDALRKLFKFHLEMMHMQSLSIWFTFVVFDIHDETDEDQLSHFADMLRDFFRDDVLSQ
jgi:hypothetical protein